MHRSSYLIPFICLWSLCLISSDTFAQEPFTDPETYTINKNLSSSSTFRVLQTCDGFLWISTELGVSRFDGKEISRYTTFDGLGDNEILDMYEDLEGRLWFIPFSGKISYYYQGKFYTEKNDARLKEIPSQYINHFIFTEDAQGTLYIPQRGSARTITRFPVKGKIEQLDLKNIIAPDDEIQLMHRSLDWKSVYCITLKNRIIRITPSGFSDVTPTYLPQKGIWWFSDIHGPATLYLDETGLYELDSTNARLLLPMSRIPFPLNKYNFTFSQDRHRNLWFSHIRYNLFLFRYTNGNYQNYTPVFSHMHANISFDREDNAWLCTPDRGVVKVPYTLLDDVDTYNLNQALPGRNLTACCTDKSGTLWVGYANGRVTSYDGFTGRHYDVNLGGRAYNRVIQLFADKADNIWCATDESCVLLKKGTRRGEASVHFLKKGNVPFTGVIKNIFSDTSGNIYVTEPYVPQMQVKGQQLVHVRSPVDHIHERIFSNYIDRKNRWYRSMKSGLKRITGEEAIDLAKKDKRLEVRVQHYAEYKDVLFLATYGSGVFALKDDHIIDVLDPSRGFPGTVCKKILLVEDTLYIASNAGVSVALFRNHKFSMLRHLGSQDGLLAADVNDLALGDQKIYAIASRGITVLHSPFEKTIAPPPSITLLSFRVNDSSYSISKAISFPYKKQHISISFIAPVVNNANLVQYRYRFANKDSTWHTSSINQTEYSDLRYGAYLFEVQAKRHNSDWSPSAKIQFVIRTPFYFSWWFISLVALVLIASLSVLIRYFLTKSYRRELKMLRERHLINKERERIAADIHDDLGSDLTNIVMLSRIMKENHSPALADTLEHSSNEVMNKMNEVIWTLNADNDSAHSLAAYLRNYTVSFLEKHGLHAEIEISEALYDTMLMRSEMRRNIFLAVKEGLHNIVKHADASKVILRLNRSDDRLEFSIIDNGRGFSAITNKEGNGFMNMRKRISALEGELQVFSETGKGTTIYASIPIV